MMRAMRLAVCAMVGAPTLLMAQGAILPPVVDPVLLVRIFWPPGTTTAAAPTASAVPLAPSAGGRSVGPTSLKIGDIILSTTDAGISAAIRVASGSDVSHAMLYVGDGLVVEAIGEGVVSRPLSEAIDEATLAVAFRHPAINPTAAAMIRDYAGKQIGKPYDYMGIVQQAVFRKDEAICGALPAAQATLCRQWSGYVDIGEGSDAKFICSQIVIAAYEHGGIALTKEPPAWGSPAELANLSFTGTLGYVGHLKWVEK